MIRWGIISTGGIASTFASELAQTESGSAVAVGSRRAASAEAFGERFGIPNRHDSYEALVADPEVDAVYVGTPHPMHHEDALLALRAGKHVLCEKPFTMNAAEAEELVAEARQRELFLMEAMWARFLPHMREVRRLLADGALGEIVHVIADHCQWFAEDRTHRLFAPELGGGALLDLGIYPVSFASMVLGRPNRVEAIADPAFTGVDAQTSILLGYESGAHALLNCTLRAVGSTRASIVGTDARIEIDGAFYEPVSFTLITREGEPQRFFDPPAEGGLRHEADEVARCIEAGELESPWMPLDETVAIMRTMDAVMAASAAR